MSNRKNNWENKKKDATGRWVRLNLYMCTRKEHTNNKVKKKINVSYRTGITKEEGLSRGQFERLNEWVPYLYDKA